MQPKQKKKHSNTPLFVTFHLTPNSLWNLRTASQICVADFDFDFKIF